MNILKAIPNLPEVGAPILNAKKAIEDKRAEAQKALERATAAHCAAMLEADNMELELTLKVRNIWTAKEIQDAAKR
jgi:hypothetical protein